MRMLRPERWVCFRGHTLGHPTLGGPGSPSTRPHPTCLSLSPRRVMGGLIRAWLPVAHVEGREGTAGGRVAASFFTDCTPRTADLRHWPSFATVSETFLCISKSWYFRFSFWTFRFRSTHGMNIECSGNKADESGESQPPPLVLQQKVHL